MAELGTIFAELLNGAVDAVAMSESRHLTAHVKALSDLKGKEPGTDELLKLFQAGWFPDYFAAAELDVEAQLVMATSRERKVSGSGSVTFGPIRIEGTLSNAFAQGTQTNLSVRATLRRQSRSSGLEYAISALSPVQVPVLPTGPPAPP